MSSSEGATIDRVHLFRFLESLRPSIVAVWKRRSCIASTRLVVEVCRHLAIEARPQKVRAMVYNTVAWRALLAGLNEPARAAAFMAYALANGGKYQRVGDWGTPARRSEDWAGHSVAIVEELHLVDLSIDQAEGVNVGFRIPPLWVSAAGFDEGVFELFLKGMGPLRVHNVAGGGVVYEAQEFDEHFRTGWESHAELVGEAARQMAERYRTAGR